MFKIYWGFSRFVGLSQLKSDRREGERWGMTWSKEPQVRFAPWATAVRSPVKHKL